MRACTDPRGAPWGSVGPPWGPTGVLRIKLCISPSDLPRLTQAGWRPLDVEKSVYTTLHPPDPDFSHTARRGRAMQMASSQGNHPKAKNDQTEVTQRLRKGKELVRGSNVS